MGRKRIIKIPKSVKIKCPECGKNNSVKFAKEGVFKLECRGCGKMIETPIMQCCLICAFSGKKCYSQLMLEAKQKNLEVRFPELF